MDAGGQALISDRENTEPVQIQLAKLSRQSSSKVDLGQTRIIHQTDSSNLKNLFAEWVGQA